MRCELVLIALLTGCGRLAFDATGDANRSDGTSCIPIGHDEDGDTIDDACDVCPQRTDNGLDSDGDGVGDECDVSPLRQTRVLFDPFTSQRSEWSSVLGTYTGDAVRFDSLVGGTGAALAAPPGRETFELTGDLVFADASMAQVLLAIGEAQPATASYYCELLDEGSSVVLQFTYTLDGSTFMNIATAPLPGRFDSGPFRIVYEHTPPTSTCWAEWKGERVSVTGTNPAGVQLEQVGIGLFQVRADMLSFVRLANP